MHRALQTIPSYAAIIETCASGGDLRRLRMVHARLLTFGIAPHDFLRVKLAAAYANCAQLSAALHIFHCAHRRPAFLFNSLIQVFASLRLHSHSLRFYLFMRSSGKFPDRHTFPSLLKSCAALSALHLGRRLHAAAVIHGFAADAANSNALITMYAKSGDVETARRVFDVMPDRNVVSWSAMVAAYGGHGRCAAAVALFEDMVAAGVAPDGLTLTSVLAACAHGGMVQDGRRVFAAMEGSFGVKRRLEHYTCMVDLLGRAGHVEEAEALIEEMDSEPDDALWGALLAACKVHGNVEVAERVAERFAGH